MISHKWFWGVSLVILTAAPGLGADLCSDILRFGVFEKYDETDARYLVSQAQRIYCSSNYSKTDAEQNLGLDVAAIVEGVPIQVGGTFDNRDQKEWREEACKYDWNSLRDWSSRKVSIAKASDSIVRAWSKCMQETKDGIVAGISFTTPTDFVLTVQVNGLETVTQLKYNSTGIRVSPEGAARFDPTDEFTTNRKIKSRKHTFRMKRTDPHGAFSLLIGSKPTAVELAVPPVTPPAEKVPQKFTTTFLNQLTPVKIDGIYNITMCADTNGFVFANGQTYPNSLYMHPGPADFSTVEWLVPLGAKKLVIDGVGFCQDRIRSSACFDTNSGFPYSSWSISIDGFMPPDGEGKIGWGHADGRSVDARPRTYDVSDKERVMFQTGAIQGRYCDHTTFLNPRFEP